MPAFVPLECNPDVFNELLVKLGVTGEEFIDIWSLDDEMLSFVPRPVRALLLVFPITPAYEAYRASSDEHHGADEAQSSIWLKQTIDNACGTMALLHAALNGIPSEAKGHGLLAEFDRDLPDLSKKDRIRYIEGSEKLASQHASVASGGTTEAPPANADIDFHYVCLTKARNSSELVELDGRRKGPIVRGSVGSDGDVLNAQAIEVIKEFMHREKDGNFSIIALVDQS